MTTTNPTVASGQLHDAKEALLDAVDGLANAVGIRLEGNDYGSPVGEVSEEYAAALVAFDQAVADAIAVSS